ncbi:uncharacterized protein LOC143532382 isoform X2 [Bidens hawaiensis]|uniref:uncharacterized protein LOC143532382 isoform X2 n=1 Tax=Bidens hawaiensis TaxID=980011 RepID=UPI00404ACB44
MENEKKKRNKKKKNKQAKTNASAAAAGELNNHANASNQIHQNLNSDNSDVPKTVADSDRDSISGTETASLEQKIKELQEQLDMHAQREADHLSQSWKERNLWHHKENELEARVSQLQTEKHSWLQKENSAAASLATLNKDNAKLQARVIELETSINHISHQNQQLKEHVSDLQLKIQDLENAVATHLSAERTKHITEYDDMNLQLESAQALVARLLSENEKLVEKVNILQIELDQKTASIQSSDPKIKNPKSADMDDTSASETDPILSSAEELDTVSNVGPLSGMPSDKLVNHMNPMGSDLNQNSRVSMESVEIVQVSLNENDAMSATSVPEPVPLTDAPLIGAPFRLISFMARYVSGADLVQK